jgi:hypothetical protein
MVNAHFNKCGHISQFKGLIAVINYWKWKDKEKAKLRKEIPIQFKESVWVISLMNSIQRILFSHWVISGAIDLGF